ncbi:MAG: hypothetical protein V3U74_01670, partial [Thermodesulfobacteriota bacterium]
MPEKEDIFGRAFNIEEGDASEQECTQEQLDSARREFERIKLEVIRPLMEKYGESFKAEGHGYEILETGEDDTTGIALVITISGEEYPEDIPPSTLNIDLKHKTCDVVGNGWINVPSQFGFRRILPPYILDIEALNSDVVDARLKVFVDFLYLDNFG